MFSLIVIAVLAICAINVIIFCRALYEWRIQSKKQSPWHAFPQTLDPEQTLYPNSVILIHGFAGSPFDYKDLAVQLRLKGFRVLVPKMPGQGMETFAFHRGRFTAEDYVAWLEGMIDREIRERGVKPCLVGLSMGGTLAVIMAARKKVDRIVLISPFFRFPKPYSATLISLLGWLIPVIPKTEKGSINDPERYARYFPGSMLMNMAAFRQLRRLAAMARKNIKHMDVPTLVQYSRYDKVASFSVSNRLLRNVALCTLREYNKGNHILLHDYEKDPLNRDIIDFLSQSA